MKRRVRPINVSSAIDVQVRFFRHYGIREYQVLAEEYLHLQNTWPSNKRFNHHFDNARSAEYLGSMVTHFHWPQTFAKATFNMRFGLENVHETSVQCRSLVLVCSPKPFEEAMPEALWKYSILFGDKEIGRLGVNFHQDDDGKVAASIANVQGKDRGPFAEYKKLNGRKLQWAFEAIQGLIGHLVGKVDVLRGISSLSHPSRFIPKKEGEKRFNPHTTLHLYDHNFARSSLGMVKKVDEAGRLIYELEK